MSDEKFVSDELAKKLGGLFYVIANSDGRVVQNERQQLSSTLKTQWMGYDFKFTKAILSEFDRANEEQPSIETSFSNFENYVQQHQIEFPKDLINLILKTSSAIGYSYAKLNKSELHYLMRLNLMFKKLRL